MNRLLQLLFIFLIGITFTACIDQEFDEPPTDGEDPGITPNATIADIKALYKAGQYVAIKEDLTIGGVVVADDRSGNYYKSFILQDATAGIEVRINQTSAYNSYPIGRQLFIKCKGLVLGDYNGVAQLGGYTYIEDGAPNLGDIVALNEHIIKGKRAQAVVPKVKKINELTTADISTLIKLENVEFSSIDVGLTFADIIGRTSLNRTIKDCNGGSILLRTSGYATFAGDKIPEGNGTIVGVYSVFGRDKQFFIREISDVVLNGTRCTGGGGSTGTETRISLQEVRNLFKAGTKTGPAGRKIVGVVISDRTTGNWDTRNLVVQDSTGGIAVRFTGNHTFNTGDAIEVVISGQELSEFNGLLQINNLDNNLAKKTGTGIATPREATVAEIKANLENWESTLVKVKSVTLTGGSTYSGSRKINDASGNVDLFTRSQASFATQPLPTGNVDVVAVVSQFTNAQLIIRTPADVTTGNGGGNPGGGGSDLISIRTLRTAFTGATTSAPAGKKIKGIVISDKDNNNWDSRNLVIQDTSGSGIVVRFTAAHSFTLGQEIEVNVGGQELSEFSGLLQVNSVANNLATLIGSGTLPVPREATAAQVVANQEAWESTLVKIKNATIASGTYSGSKNVTDGSGTVVMFTRTQATFSSQAVPGAAVEITAIVSQFNTPQIIIRNTADIK